MDRVAQHIAIRLVSVANSHRLVLQYVVVYDVSYRVTNRNDSSPVVTLDLVLDDFRLTAAYNDAIGVIKDFIFSNEGSFSVHNKNPLAAPVINMILNDACLVVSGEGVRDVGL
jgi:hypothetical protein